MDQRRAGSSVGGTSNTSNMRSMTAPTPEQMRALAVDAVRAAENADRQKQTAHALRYRKMAAALRAAADQLEVVQDRDRISSAIGEVLFNVSNYPPSVSFRLLGQDIGPLRAKVTNAVLAILTAVTAPQEGCDECGVVTEDPVPTYCTKLHGHDGDHNAEGAV